MGYNYNKFKVKPSSLYLKITLVVISIILIILAISFYKNKGNKVENVGEMDQIIKEWVEKNPEIIFKSLVNMQQKAQENSMVNSKETLKKRKDELNNDKVSPAYNDSKFDVTVIEFFDYSCGYCKRANSTVNELIKSDNKVRIIYREFPVLGKLSEDLAKIALAVNINNKKDYKAFHDALMANSIENIEAAYKILDNLNIDSSKIDNILKAKSADIEKILNHNRELAAELGINGTPAFIVGDEIIPGAVGVDAIKEKIKAVRD